MDEQLDKQPDDRGHQARGASRTPSDLSPAVPAGAPRPRRGRRAPHGEEPEVAAEDADLPLRHAGVPVPSRDEMFSAMAWAFRGEDVQSALLERYVQHALLVLEGNRSMNLTAVVDPMEMAAKHYLDSWRATRLLPLPGRSVLDLGTGAGYPGVPVALAEPQAKVCMVDSTQKRITFIQACLESMGCANATAHWARAEDHLQRNQYDLVLMRAVSSVRENVRLLRKVKHSMKDLAMLKGPSWSREARAAEREVERLGFRLDTVWEHTLPGEMGARAILVYRAPGGQGN